MAKRKIVLDDNHVAGNLHMNAGAPSLGAGHNQKVEAATGRMKGRAVMRFHSFDRWSAASQLSELHRNGGKARLFKPVRIVIALAALLELSCTGANEPDLWHDRLSGPQLSHGEEAELELPSGARCILRSLRFLDDGSLVLKIGGEPDVYLFAPSGKLRAMWPLPEQERDWRRVSSAMIIGDDMRDILFVPRRPHHPEGTRRAYPLFVSSSETAASAIEVSWDRAARAAEGYWVERGGRVLFLGNNMEVEKVARFEEGGELKLRSVRAINAAPGGGLAVLEGPKGSLLDAADAVQKLNYSIHLISEDALLWRSVRFCVPPNQLVDGFDYFDGRVLLSCSTFAPTGRGRSGFLYSLDLGTGGLQAVEIPNGAWISFRKGAARVIADGRVLKVFDSSAGSVHTYLLEW